jgi:DHA1 family multidrug resistance protein-like MFS transporter
MAQFGVKTVQPMITLYVKEMIGDLSTVATLAGIAFSITGVANIIAAPFLGGRSDRVGYRQVLLICLVGGMCPRRTPWWPDRSIAMTEVPCSA